MPLKKTLKFAQVFSITVGSMISSGIFILPAVAYAKAGPSIFAAYIMAGIFALIGSFSMIELTTAMPKAGGVYFFTSRSLGGMVGTLSGIIMWIAISMKSAFAIYGLSFILSFCTGYSFYIFTIIFVVIYTGINIKGIKEAATLDVLLVSLIIVLMIVFSFIGIPNVDIDFFTPFIANNGNILTVIETAAFVFIAFGGVMNAASISEEMADPKKDIPKAILTAILLITILYGLIIFTTVGLLNGNDLARSVNPVADAARIILGTPGFIIITIAACMAFSSCANSGIMSSSRYPFALSKDGFLPKIFGYVNPRTNTPIISIIATATFILCVLQLTLKTLIAVASTVIITSYILTDLSVIVLRASRINTYRPTFKAPFFPFLQITSIIIFISLIFFMGYNAIKLSIELILISFAIYFVYARNKTTSYALQNVIKRGLTIKQTTGNLEDELKDIIYTRDNVIKDEFDKLIESSTVISIDKQMELNEFFQYVSELLEMKVGYTKEVIFRLLSENEKENSTVVLPHVAIPHLVIETDECFEILLARCRKGVVFSKEYPDINVVILFIGSKNKMNLHMKTLMAIAQIIQDENFNELWNRAPNINSLKNIFLAGNRIRYNK